MFNIGALLTYLHTNTDTVGGRSPESGGPGSFPLCGVVGGGSFPLSGGRVSVRAGGGRSP